MAASPPKLSPIQEWLISNITTGPAEVFMHPLFDHLKPLKEAVLESQRKDVNFTISSISQLTVEERAPGITECHPDEYLRFLTCVLDTLNERLPDLDPKQLHLFYNAYIVSATCYEVVSDGLLMSKPYMKFVPLLKKIEWHIALGRNQKILEEGSYFARCLDSWLNSDYEREIERDLEDFGKLVTEFATKILSCMSFIDSGHHRQTLLDWFKLTNLVEPYNLMLTTYSIAMECLLSSYMDVEKWFKNMSMIHALLLVPDSGEAFKFLKCLSFAAPTCYNFFTNCNDLQQELKFYENVEEMYPMFSLRMQVKIILILYAKDAFVQRLSYMISLVEKGRSMRANNLINVVDSIDCFAQAISRLSEIHEDIVTRNDLVCHHLAVARSLHALCTQEVNPKSEEFINDISDALDKWTSIEILDESTVVETVALVHNITALASLKGYTKHHQKTYNLLVRLYELQKIPVEEYWPDLWLCKKLSHAACISPVNEAFLACFTGELAERSNELWNRCLRHSYPLELVFKLAESIYCVDIVKSVIDFCSNIDPLCNRSKFIAAYLFHELSERLMLNGETIEAFCFAKEGIRLRFELLRVYFDNTQYGSTSLPSEFWSSKSAQTGQTLPNCSITSWSVLQSALDSALQIGTIHEILGDSVQAEQILNWGEWISSSNNFSTFSVGFSSLLGQIYCKKHNYAAANDKLQGIKSIDISICECKCRHLLEATVEQQLGDLHRSQIDDNAEENLLAARNLYNTVLDKLNHPVWTDTTKTVGQGTCLASVIQLRWESFYKRLYLRLLNGSGNCLRFSMSLQGAYEVFQRSIEVLAGEESPKSVISFLGGLGGKNLINGFTNELVCLVLNFGWSYLNCYPSTKSEIYSYNELSTITVAHVFQWLKLAFVFSREIPLLFQEVSRLLVICTESFPYSISLEELSASQWAAFFHQASIGSHFNLQLLLKITEKCSSSSLESGVSETDKFKNAPKTVEGLASFVEEFCRSAPEMSVVCISLLGDNFAKLLNTLLLNSHNGRAWVLLSRLQPNSGPFVGLLPVNSVLKDEKSSCPSESTSAAVDETSSSGYDTCSCPWGSTVTVVDVVTPRFRSILKDINNFSTDQDCTNIDNSIRQFLQDLEQLLFGQWKGILSNQDLHPPPMILVLDDEIHMLPWESVQILSDRELYRMPSVISITHALARQQDNCQAAAFPSIDPTYAFYLLNPDRQFDQTQSEFIDWYQGQKLNMEMFGTFGKPPVVDDLARALGNCDLYIYVGHGDGSKYISASEILKLEKCAACLLLGCRSGSLKLHGSYKAEGLPLTCLLAGSKFVIGNLWNVEDQHLNQLSFSLLTSLLKERLTPSAQCPRVGLFLSQARNECDTPFFTGASPVCYGIPTGVTRKADLSFEWLAKEGEQQHKES